MNTTVLVTLDKSLWVAYDNTGDPGLFFNRSM